MSGGRGAFAPSTLKIVTVAGGSPGTYELAQDPTRSTLATAITVAREAEAARFHGLFTADLLSFGAQGAIGAQESLIYVAALSQVTTHAGLIATVSSTFHHPYNLARQFGTLDHVSNGRAAWNLVTSSVGEENFSAEDLPAPEDRYARAAEVLDVTNALWDSWGAGALGLDERGRAVLEADLVQPINHHGRFFDVAGPLNIPPLPQRRPVQLQAGQSEAGVALGARYTEVVFTSLPTMEIALDFATRIRSQAKDHGRPDGLPLIMSSFHATYGSTEEEARRALRDKHEAIDLERARPVLEDMLGGADLSGLPWELPIPAERLPEVSEVNRRRGRVEIFRAAALSGRPLRELIIEAQDTGHWAPVGTAEQLADAIEERFHAGVLDVLSIGGLGDGQRREAIVDGLLPELRRRGLLESDYRADTFRELLELPAQLPGDPAP